MEDFSQHKHVLLNLLMRGKSNMNQPSYLISNNEST